MLFAHNNSRFELIHLPLHAFNEPLPPLSVWRQATRANVEPLSATLCCQQNPTRDTGGRGPSSSICIVGELSGAVDSPSGGCVCMFACLNIFYLRASSGLFFGVFVVFFLSPRLWKDYWKQKLAGVVAVVVCLCTSEEVKPAGPILRSTHRVPH